MNSEEINRALWAIDFGPDEEHPDRPDLGQPAELTLAGKRLPYLGWYWREFNWDAESYWFSVMPGVGWGFCVSDKWGYGGRTATPEDSKKVREAAELLCEEPTDEHLRAFFVAVQAAAAAGESS